MRGPSDFFYRLMPRTEWDKEPRSIEGLKPLHLPVKYIVITWTGTDQCSSREECAALLTKMKHRDMEYKKWPDIRYNFFIASDGLVYEGRGWFFEGQEYRPLKSKESGEINGSCIQVAYIDRERNKPTDLMDRALGGVITMGLEEDYLKDRFKFHYRTGNNTAYFHSHDKRSEKQKYKKQEGKPPERQELDVFKRDSPYYDPSKLGEGRTIQDLLDEFSPKKEKKIKPEMRYKRPHRRRPRRKDRRPKEK